MLTAHQPNYLPYPGFFQKIAAADAFLLVDTTQFVKRGPFGWIHRNRIRGANGPQWLSLPVLNKGKYEQSIAEAKLNHRVDWRRKHFKAIQLSYQKTPHWERFGPGLEEIYQREWSHVAKLNTTIIQWFLKTLELDDRAFHTASSLSASGKSSDYIVAFCQELGADEFLSGIHGRDYLQMDQFEKARIEVHFQNYTPPTYDVDPKWETPGESNYSMLDALMWSGDEIIRWVHEPQECRLHE